MRLATNRCLRPIPTARGFTRRRRRSTCRWDGPIVRWRTSTPRCGSIRNRSRRTTTSADAAIRRPAEAVQLAERAAALTNRADLRALDTLAAAHAAAGDFRRAVEIAESALQIAARRGRSDDASLVRARADLYRHHRPYRDSMLVER